MIICVMNKQFDTNPTGVSENLLLRGTVHTGTGVQENVYGFTESDVLNLAYKLKELNRDFNIVHLYSPNGEYIGVRFL